MKLSGEKKEQAEYHDLKDRDSIIDLVNRCQDGDTDAMERVYIAYKSSLLSLAYRFTGDSSLAEDLFQEIFIKIFINIKKLRSPEAFNSWLYRIAVNTCMSYARKKGKTREVPLKEKELENPGDSENSGSQVRQQIAQAVRELPPRQKTVFLLHDVEGFTHNEIAGIMKSSEGTAKSQLFKARMKIRNLLRGTYNEMFKGAKTY